jgi:hypothetical protein
VVRCLTESSSPFDIERATDIPSASLLLNASEPFRLIGAQLSTPPNFVKAVVTTAARFVKSHPCTIGAADIASPISVNPATPHPLRGFFLPNGFFAAVWTAIAQTWATGIV